MKIKEEDYTLMTNKVTIDAALLILNNFRSSESIPKFSEAYNKLCEIREEIMNEIQIKVDIDDL